jgi:hypothetical protein
MFYKQIRPLPHHSDVTGCREASGLATMSSLGLPGLAACAHERPSPHLGLVLGPLDDSVGA